MSHTVAVKHTQMTDAVCLEKAISRLNLPAGKHGRHELFDGKVVEGISIRLPNWTEPVVVDKAGQAFYDNYGGKWGAQVELDKLIQAYGLEKAADELTQMGYTGLTEHVEENGDVKLEAVCYA